jgi:hypothetical protein
VPFSPLADLLGALAQTFRELGLRWYVFGAQAAILHGAARLTADVDVTVELASRSIPDLLDALTRTGFVSRVPDPRDFADRTRVIPLVHQGTRVPVDIVLAGPGLEAIFLDHAEEHVIGNVRIPVASAGDVVLMKVLAGRPKDLEDVVAILRARRADIDVETVRTSLRALEQALGRADLVEALDRALADAARRPGP